MRCSRKSTTWRASAALALWLPLAATAQAEVGVPAAERAIADAVRQAMRAGDDVAVQIVACDAADLALVDAARPEPGGRLARPTRFRLLAGGRQVGSATAVVTARVTYLRLRQAVRAGQPIQAAALETVVGVPEAIAIERLPTAEEIAGALAARDLAEGEIVNGRVARIPPAVRSGDQVAVRVVSGAVEVRALAVAQQSGRIGDVIRVINPSSRRPLRARVVGKAQVEVVHGS
jgi:flagella basal body P-ring formation protein FlgA